MLVLFHLESGAEMSWNLLLLFPHLQHIERCYQSRSDSSALLYLLYSLWSECEAPHIQADESLQISVSSISRAEQTLAQSEWESPHLQSECTRVFILTWFMITNPTNTPTSSPLEIDERIMKLRRQQLDKKQTQESSLVKLKLNGVIKTFQQEETLLQRWATTELLINRQPCIL